jgi:hypothetical protein
MPDANKPSSGKVIVFRFRGGNRDGQAICSDQPREGLNEANAFWAMTRKGVVGRRFDVPAPGTSGAYHRYKVVSKHEVGGEIHVTCEHVG